MTRVRFAPSPTGYLHIGGARTALYNFLLAHQSAGQFLLRIEDTDRERFVPTAEQDLKDGLRWLGLQWDEGPDVGGPCAPYIQSQRTARHAELAHELVQKGNAYYCFCTKERLDALKQSQLQEKKSLGYDRCCRDLSASQTQQNLQAGMPFVIRFKTPLSGETVVHDLLRGEIRIKNSTLDDFILLKSDGFAVYHLAAMADDHDMSITLVMRGEEWLPSLPRHAMIIRAFGWNEPTWCHLALFNKPTGKGKLSKRDVTLIAEGGYSIFIKDLKAMGYLPQAVNNWIALMGAGFDEKEEIFDTEALIKRFKVENLIPSAAAVNFTKVDYFQGYYVRQLSDPAFADHCQPFLDKAGIPADRTTLLKIVPIIKERLISFEEVVEMVGFFFHAVQPSPADLLPKGLDALTTRTILQKTIQTLQACADFTATTTHPVMEALAQTLNLSVGQTFTPLRVAISGQKVSPPLFESMEILGQEVVLQRLAHALNLL
jgi:glutamyl-tRNA synthetase